MKLREYQLRTIKFMHEQKNAILSVGMGLGKTAAVLALRFLQEFILSIFKPPTIAITKRYMLNKYYFLNQ